MFKLSENKEVEKQQFRFSSFRVLYKIDAQKINMKEFHKFSFKNALGLIFFPLSLSQTAYIATPSTFLFSVFSFCLHYCCRFAIVIECSPVLVFGMITMHSVLYPYYYILLCFCSWQRICRKTLIENTTRQRSVLVSDSNVFKNNNSSV